MLLQKSLQTARLERSVKNEDGKMDDERQGEEMETQVDGEGRRDSEGLPSMSSYDLMMKQVAADLSRPTVVTRIEQDADGRLTAREKCKQEAAHVSEGVLDDDEIMSETNGDLLLSQFGNNGDDGAVTAYNTNLGTYCNDPYFYLP